MKEPGGPASSGREILPYSATRTLRVAFGILFLWLGLLKVIPGMSPAEDLMRASMPPFVPIDLFIRFAAVWEIVIGVGFLTGTLRRLVLLMTFATMAVTLSLLWLAPGRVWDSFPFGLTFDGVYVVKDLVIAASAIVLAVATVQERPGLGSFGEAVRRRRPIVIERYVALEGRVTSAIAPWSVPVLRATLGVVFIWFGLLNLVDPTNSPTWFMVEAAIPGGPGEEAFRIWSTLGVFAGIGIVTGRFDRVAVAILVAMMVVSASWFVLAPDLMFQHPPFVLSLEGQHVVKNAVLAAAAITVVRARPTPATAAPTTMPQPGPRTSSTL